jgi:phosphatidate cytidylyltransferase
VRERVISAAVLVPVVVAVFLLGNPWLTAGIAALAVFAAYETSWLLRQAGQPVEPLVPMIAAPVAVLGTLPGVVPGALVVVLVPAVIVGAAIAGFRRLDTRQGFLVWSSSSFGALYVSLLAFIPAILLVAPAVPAGNLFSGVLDPGRVWLLILVLCVWGFDTFAYVSGRAIGRGRFMNHISPNKTWSGVIGGLAAAIVIGAALVSFAGESVITGVVLGVVVAVTAQSGDLAESMLKRAAHAKDSGNLIPGHGGVLDRVDSFLFAAPAMFALLVVLDWIR